MNFIQAFSETIGKEAASAPEAVVQNPEAVVQNQEPQNRQDMTSDDMRAYVDAKFEALKSDLLHEMQQLNKTVETPKETDKGSQEIKKITQEGGNENVSNTDLSNN